MVMPPPVVRCFCVQENCGVVIFYVPFPPARCNILWPSIVRFVTFRFTSLSLSSWNGSWASAVNGHRMCGSPVRKTTKLEADLVSNSLGAFALSDLQWAAPQPPSNSCCRVGVSLFRGYSGGKPWTRITVATPVRFCLFSDRGTDEFLGAVISGVVNGPPIGGDQTVGAKALHP